MLIVCASGHGTARILQENLQNLFTVEVADVISAHALPQYTNLSGIDLIVSTVTVKAGLPVVVVTPLLTDRDILAIQEALLGVGDKRTGPAPSPEERSILAKEIQAYTSMFDTKENETILIEKVQKLLERNGRDGQGQLEGRPCRLSEVLKPAYIILDAAVSSWRESIHKAGSVLVESGAITRTYVEAAVATAEEMGPYIVVTKGVAIPHAGNRQGVFETAISFLRLKTPINYGSKYNDPVKYVFMLATVDATSHIRALSELMSLLNHQEFIRCIEEADVPELVWEYINNHQV